MQIIFSDEFRKDFNRINDKATKIRIVKQLKKLEQVPEAGKPLKYLFRNCRSVRVQPFRIVYRIENGIIFIICFEHRNKVYK